MGEQNNAMIICPKCGHSNISVAKFCAKCSASLNLKQQDSAPLSVSDRIKELQGYADEMLVNLKTFAFQEFETVVATIINTSQVCPSVYELKEAFNLDASNNSESNKVMSEVERKKLLDVQCAFVKKIELYTSSSLPLKLSQYETNKIEKVGQGEANCWLTLSQKYGDLCGQLKSLGKFDDADLIDFSQVFNGPLDSICKNPRASGKEIIDTVGVEMSAVNSNSIKQIKFLQKFKDHLYVIGHRAA